MSEQIETTLSHISKFAPFEDIYGASHFPIYNTGTFDLKSKKVKKSMIIQEVTILQEKL
ncbi:hypothetical protein ACN2C3_02670 [Aliarcobacter butzleri]